MCGMCSQVLGSRLLAGVALPDQPTGRSGIQLFFRSNTSRIWWRPVRSRVKAVQVKFPVARCPGTGQARCRSCACSSLLAKCFSAGKSSHQRANARTKLGHPQPTPTLAATGTPRDKIVAPRVRVCVKTPHRVHISRVGNASTTMGRGYATLFSSFHTDSSATGQST